MHNVNPVILPARLALVPPIINANPAKQVPSRAIFIIINVSVIVQRAICAILRAFVSNVIIIVLAVTLPAV